MSLSLYHPEEVYKSANGTTDEFYELYLVSTDDASVTNEAKAGRELIRHQSDWLLFGQPEHNSHDYLVLATKRELGGLAVVGASKLTLESVDSPTPQAWLSGVAVAKGHRHRGISTRLIAKAEDLAFDLGAPEIGAIIAPESEGRYRDMGYSTARQRGLSGALFAKKTLAD